MMKLILSTGIFIILLVTTSCGGKRSSANFQITAGALVTGYPVDGGVYLRAVNSDGAVINFDLISEDYASIPFGTWDLYLVGYAGPVLWGGTKTYCGSVNEAKLESGQVTLNVNLNANNCASEPYVSMMEDKSGCPSTHGDYIAVVPNPIVGTTSRFCVAKYEMRNVGGIATSQASGSPWININQVNSRTACSNLGAGYGLISNQEWMTIAREIETTDANWSSGIVGSGSLNRGHSDNGPSTILAISNALDPYDSTLNNSGQPVGSGWEQKRTHTLSYGEIWDLAGNAQEWVDWNVTPSEKAYFSGNGSPVASHLEWTSIDTKISNGDEMETITWQSTDPSLNSAHGIGRYYSGTNAVGGAAFRGGGQTFGAITGIFALTLSASSTDIFSNLGFRCVYRPF